MRRFALAVLAVVLSSWPLASCVAPPDPAAAWGEARSGHRVLLGGSDPRRGGGRLAIAAVDAAGRLTEIEWEMPWGGIHDVHRLANGNVMVQRGAAELVEIDVESRQVVWSHDSAARERNAGRRVEVHSFQPLADGTVMIAESGPARLVVVDRAGALVRELPLFVENPDPHRDTRLVRVLDGGTVLVCHEGDGCVREYALATGALVWDFHVPLFGRERQGGHGQRAFGNQCFAALRLPSGNTLIATGNGHSVLEVSPAREIVWQLTQDELPGIALAWVTTLELLENGHYVIGNCHAGPGQPLLIEIEPRTKRVVWRFDGWDEFGDAVSNSMLLDVRSRR